MRAIQTPLTMPEMLPMIRLISDTTKKGITTPQKSTLPAYSWAVYSVALTPTLVSKTLITR